MAAEFEIQAIKLPGVDKNGDEIVLVHVSEKLHLRLTPDEAMRLSKALAEPKPLYNDPAAEAAFLIFQKEDMESAHVCEPKSV